MKKEKSSPKKKRLFEKRKALIAKNHQSKEANSNTGQLKKINTINLIPSISDIWNFTKAVFFIILTPRQYIKELVITNKTKMYPLIIFITVIVGIKIILIEFNYPPSAITADTFLYELQHEQMKETGNRHTKDFYDEYFGLTSFYTSKMLLSNALSMSDFQRHLWLIQQSLRKSANGNYKEIAYIPDTTMNETIFMLFNAYFIRMDGQSFIKDFLLARETHGASCLQYMLEYEAGVRYASQVLYYLKEMKPEKYGNAVELLKSMEVPESKLYIITNQIGLIIGCFVFSFIVFVLFFGKITYTQSLSILCYILSLFCILRYVTYFLLFNFTPITLPFLYLISFSFGFCLLQFYIFFAIPSALNVSKLKSGLICNISFITVAAIINSLF